MKKRSEETQTLRAGCSGGAKKFRPAADPLPVSAGRPRFNQLEMVTLHLQTQFVEDRCTQFRVIVATGPHTQTHTNPQIGPITIYTAPQLASAQYNNVFLWLWL